MASAIPLVLYLLLVLARDESAPPRLLQERTFYSRYGLLAILILSCVKRACAPTRALEAAG